jgi:hypothetical protein
MDELSRNRIELDMISATGPAFEKFDDRSLNLQLLQTGLPDAVLFNSDGEVCLASEELYKKNILIARGSYRPPTFVNMDLMRTGIDNFSKDTKSKPEEIVNLAEITISNLNSAGEYAHEDFLARVDLLSSINQPVLITNFPQYFKLSTYLQRFKPKNIAIVLGAYNFMQIFDNEYNQATGEILEALGMLFRPNVCIYLYPYKEENQNDELINLNSVSVADDKKPLLEYVKSTEKVKDLVGVDDNNLHIYSRKLLKMITSGEEGWEKYVPEEISKTINEKCLFGHPCNIDQ